jgi:hypothetical protein
MIKKKLDLLLSLENLSTSFDKRALMKEKIEKNRFA